MAKAKINNIPVEERLTALYELQKIDTQIDNLNKLKGELPTEVENLENEITALNERNDKLKEDIKDLESKMSKSNSQIADGESLIAKYERQQESIKNSREYDSIMQQIELQKLDIQLVQKKNKETKANIALKEQLLEQGIKKRDAKNKEADTKREDLKKIIARTEKDEKALIKQREKARKVIEERLLRAYDRIRAFYTNDGLAVVSLERGSCEGCHNQLPPQMIVEMRSRKKIHNCEHCGRIFVDRQIAYPHLEHNQENGDMADFPDYSEEAWED
jgi:uncharacterized protein